MTSKHRAPASSHAFCPDPRTPRPGQRAWWVTAQGTEDADEVTRRVRAYPWGKHVIGRPIRIGDRWQFIAKEVRPCAST